MKTVRDFEVPQTAGNFLANWGTASLSVGLCCMDLDWHNEIWCSLSLCSLKLMVTESAFSAVKVAGAWGWSISTHSGDVQNAWTHICTFLYVFMSWTGTILPCFYVLQENTMLDRTRDNWNFGPCWCWSFRAPRIYASACSVPNGSDSFRLWCNWLGIIAVDCAGCD